MLKAKTCRDLNSCCHHSLLKPLLYDIGSKILVRARSKPRSGSHNCNNPSSGPQRLHVGVTFLPRGVTMKPQAPEGAWFCNKTSIASVACKWRRRGIPGATPPDEKARWPAVGGDSPAREGKLRAEETGHWHCWAWATLWSNPSLPSLLPPAAFPSLSPQGLHILLVPLLFNQLFPSYLGWAGGYSSSQSLNSRQAQA